MRLVALVLTLGLVLACGCTPSPRTECTETADALNCEAARDVPTCVPFQPDAPPCEIPPAEATEDAKNAEEAIRADLGVTAYVTSYPYRRWRTPYLLTVVIVRLGSLPPHGDVAHALERVEKMVSESFPRPIGIRIVLDGQTWRAR